MSHAEGGQRGSLSAKKAVRRVKVKKPCEVEGCTTPAQSKGLCVKHGGGTKKPCEVEGCWHLAQKGVYCAKHGGRYCCSVEGCEKYPRKGGLCKKHFAQAEE